MQEQQALPSYTHPTRGNKLYEKGDSVIALVGRQWVEANMAEDSYYSDPEGTTYNVIVWQTPILSTMGNVCPIYYPEQEAEEIDSPDKAYLIDAYGKIDERLEHIPSEFLCINNYGRYYVTDECEEEYYRHLDEENGEFNE